MTMAPPTNHTSILPQQLNSRVQPSRSVGKYTKGILVFSAAGKRFLTPMTNTRTVTRKYAAMKGNSSGLSALQGTTPRDLRISRQIASAARDAPEQNAVVRVAIGNATARSLDFPKLANSRRSPRRAGRPAANDPAVQRRRVAPAAASAGYAGAWICLRRSQFTPKINVEAPQATTQRPNATNTLICAVSHRQRQPTPYSSQV